MIGTQLGPYRIVGRLGAGGMGEVYRAHDPKLNRDVALKILPESFAADADRIMRFEREAQTLAALNHPHIAQIHGFEQSGARSALVMELVEGEDLAERLARGPLPIDEALPIARQIVEGLEAAHAAGVIHRDLKPANVKVRADGTVKVLDFGLAKGTDAPGAAASGFGGATVTSPAMTAAGMILGTAAYMAPEQAKGKAVDKRADIWALGCVLYEMLAGRRAFDGDDVSDTLAAVLRGEPDWSALPHATPQSVVTVIRRCLERDVRRRVADVSIVRFVLDESYALASTAVAAQASGQAPVPVEARIADEVARARHRLLGRVAPLMLLLVAAAAGAAYLGARALAPPPTVPTLRFAIVPQERQIGTLIRTLMAVSPDGSQLVYLANGRAHIRRFADFQEQIITSPDLGRTAIAPAFSPDGGAIAFFSGSERLVKKIDLRGGAPQRVCNVPTPAAFGITWEPGGILVGAGADGVVRCDPAGGTPQTLAKVESGEEASSPSLLPGGDGLLFAVAPASDGTQWDNARLVVQSLKTGARKTIVEGGSDPRYLPTGHLLYMQGGVVYAMAFDAAAQERRGDPVPVIEGVRRSGGSTHLSVAANGLAVYVPGPVGTTSARALGVGDRGGSITALPIPTAGYAHVRASRDGGRLAIGTAEGEQGIIWIYALDGSAAMQRLMLDGNNRYPIWSPDGLSVAFQSDRANAPGIYRQRVDGSGGVDRLTSAAAGEAHVPESWSPDGRHLAFSLRKDGRYTLLTVAIDSKRIEPFDSRPSLEPANAAFSPDGRWVAYVHAPTDDLTSSDRGVFIRSFPAGANMYQAPRQMVDFHPVWSRDGRELIFIASTTAGQMTSVRVTAESGITFGAPTRFPTTVTGDRLSSQTRAYDLLPDGRFVGPITADEGRRALSEFRVIVNWFDELRARVSLK